MHGSSTDRNIVEIDTSVPVWEQFFTVAPLVLIGTYDEDGSLDLAPKHMVTPMGWQNYFGFVCTLWHDTCQNSERDGVVTVSYPKLAQLLMIRRPSTHRHSSPTWLPAALPRSVVQTHSHFRSR